MLYRSKNEKGLLHLKYQIPNKPPACWPDLSRDPPTIKYQFLGHRSPFPSLRLAVKTPFNRKLLSMSLFPKNKIIQTISTFSITRKVVFSCPIRSYQSIFISEKDRLYTVLVKITEESVIQCNCGALVVGGDGEVAQWIGKLSYWRSFHKLPS